MSLTFDVLTDSIEKKRDPEGHKARVAKTRAEEEEAREKRMSRGDIGFEVSRNQSGFRFSLDFKKLLCIGTSILTFKISTDLRKARPLLEPKWLG